VGESQTKKGAERGWEADYAVVVDGEKKSIYSKKMRPPKGIRPQLLADGLSNKTRISAEPATSATTFRLPLQPKTTNLNEP
jgi:hypothetical protein